MAKTSEQQRAQELRLLPMSDDQVHDLSQQLHAFLDELQPGCEVIIDGSELLGGLLSLQLLWWFQQQVEDGMARVTFILPTKLYNQSKMFGLASLIRATR